MSDCNKPKAFREEYLVIQNDSFKVEVINRVGTYGYIYPLPFCNRTFYAPIAGSPSGVLDQLLVKMDMIVTDARDIKSKLEVAYAEALVAEKEKKC